MELNKALEEKAKVTWVCQGKAKAKRLAKEERLGGIQLLEEATYEELACMKLCDLDNQIDKLQEQGYKSIRAKSMIGNKQAKIRAILDGLDRRRHHKMAETAYQENHLVSDSFDIESGRISDNESGMEDAEMCFNDEIIF